MRSNMSGVDKTPLGTAHVMSAIFTCAVHTNSQSDDPPAFVRNRRVYIILCIDQAELFRFCLWSGC